LTQSSAAKLVGVEYGSSISSMELGRISLPPERYALFAQAYNIEPKALFMLVLKLTNPWGYAMLFEDDPKAAIEKINIQFHPERTE
jgi:hypothetical protein